MSDLTARGVQEARARLEVALLGPPLVLLDGTPVAGLRSPKVLALLAFLAVERDRPHSRVALAEMLWPDQPEAQSLRNLRKTLSRLRRVIADDEAEPQHLLVDSQAIGFNRTSDCSVDIDRFDACLATAESHAHRRMEACAPCLRELARACSLYRGEFLAELHVTGCSAGFDEWVVFNRERMRLSACSTFQTLASASLAGRDYKRARDNAQYLIQLDPLSESAQRLLLRALAASDGRNAALMQYSSFVERLRLEIGVEPEDETRELVDRIRDGELRAVPPPRLSESIPMPATSLVGRAFERQRISELLGGRDQRLITLHGPGGSGKTRLALDAAETQAYLWRDGVTFVPLDAAIDLAGLVEAVADSLDLTPERGQVSAEQLPEHLAPLELLLILDGFEHVMDAAPLLSRILSAAPEVNILVTSHSLLGLPDEWSIEVRGLSVPESQGAIWYPAIPAPGADGDASNDNFQHMTEQVERAQEHGAPRLFTHSARRHDPGFRLTLRNLPHVVRICNLVSGLPLGIELAAAWVRYFSCSQIATEIERSPDFLVAPANDGPERQQSLRATFDYSYGLLVPAERALFRRLSVFRGGFTAEAARHVAGADPAELASLADKSLLAASGSGRLNTHRMLRVYAAEKLAEQHEEEARVQREHSRYYLAYVAARRDALKSDRAREAIDDVSAETANVRIGWDLAVEQAMLPELQAALPSLSQYYQLRGQYQLAESTFGAAAEQLPRRRDGDEARHLALLLTLEHAEFTLCRGQHNDLVELASAAIGQARAEGDVLAQATGLYLRGTGLWYTGEHDRARADLQRAFELAKVRSETDEDDIGRARKIMVRCLNLLAGTCWSRGEHADAEAYLEQMLSIVSLTGNPTDEAAALGNLGVIAVEQGRYSDAIKRYEQAMRLQQEAGRRDSAGYTNLGELYLEVGAYEDSERYLRQALEIKRETGARATEGLVLGYLSLLYHRLGGDETSLEHSRQGYRIAKDVGDTATQADMLMRSGDALQALGRLHEASDAYQCALSLRRGLDQTNLSMETLAGLASVSLAQGDAGSAQEPIEAILAHLVTGSLDGTPSPCEIYLTCWRVLSAAGDDRGQRMLDDACDLLNSRAEMIDDEEMRHSFLNDVAAHREIVARCSRCEVPGDTQREHAPRTRLLGRRVLDSDRHA